MRFHSFLIKYGEIGIKGKNRYMFEDALVRQIRYALKDVDGEFIVHKCHGRVYVDCEGEYDYEETVESLKKVFGLVGICPVVRKPVREIEELKKDIVAYVGEMYPEGNKTFKVEARRANKRYPMNSMEINCELGEGGSRCFSGYEGGRPPSGCETECGDPRGGLYLFGDYSGSGRYASGNERKRYAAVIRRY